MGTRHHHEEKGEERTGNHGAPLYCRTVGTGTRTHLFDATLAKLRRFCLRLPETREVPSWGHPNFKAGRKMFACLEEARGALAVCFRTRLLDRESLLADSRFFIPPYAGTGGWVAMKVTARMDWGMLEVLLLESYRRVALKRMLRALESPKEPRATRSSGSKPSRRSPRSRRSR